MSHYALVSGGVVVDFVICESEFLEGSPYTPVLISPINPVQRGYLYDGVKFTPPLPPSEPISIFHASTKLLGGSVITDSTWQTLDGIVTEPGFFADVKYLVGQIVVSVKAVGTGAQLHLLEDDGAGSIIEIGLWTVRDTGGQWSPAAFDSDHPRTGTHTYILEGRLNGAVSLDVRFASMVLLERR